MRFNWPLNSDNFTFLDRIRVANFILNKKNKLTMGLLVEELEYKMEKFSKIKCLGVSSGSSANHLIFELYKQKYRNGKIDDVIIICPAVTWISSISPAIMSGFNVIFCDVNLDDFCFDYNKLEKILIANHNKQIIIWPTALIGFVPDIKRLNELSKKYNAELFCDCAENTLSNYDGKSILSMFKMSSTSMYFSHMLTSVEFGFVFFQNNDDYKFGKMLRNHGLIRSLEQNDPLRLKIEKENSSIDNRFLFAVNGTNWRPTDCHAIWGLMDFNRIYEYKKHRKTIYSYFESKINKNKYYLPIRNDIQEHVGFCLPVFVKSDNKSNYIKKILEENGIETRPIIGSNLLIQPVFKQNYSETIKYGNLNNAEWIHEHGFYIGLNYNLKKTDIDDLTILLNEL